MHRVRPPESKLVLINPSVENYLQTIRGSFELIVSRSVVRIELYFDEEYISREGATEDIKDFIVEMKFRLDVSSSEFLKLFWELDS